MHYVGGMYRPRVLLVGLVVAISACGASKVTTAVQPAGTAAAPVASSSSAGAPASSAAATTAGGQAATSSTSLAGAAPASSTLPAATAATSTIATPSILKFSVPKVGGGTVNGSDYAGKPVAFWFWAPG